MTTANQASYDTWNGDSGRRWVTDPDRRDHVMQNVAAVLLEAADLTVGDSVLDVGCGCGATALAAARGVGVDGAVLGVDLSKPMLDVARQRVAAARLPNITLLHADAQTHPFEPGGHDIAISRLGTMFFDDPVAAFSNIASSIRHGGRLHIATWQPLVANDWLTIPGAALLRYGNLPEPAGTAPGMFAQSDPEIAKGILARSGFTDIDVQAATVPLRLGADPTKPPHTSPTPASAEPSSPPSPTPTTPPRSTPCAPSSPSTAAPTASNSTEPPFSPAQPDSERRAAPGFDSGLGGGALEHVAEGPGSLDVVVVDLVDVDLEAGAGDELVDGAVEVAAAGDPPLERCEAVLPAGNLWFGGAAVFEEVEHTSGT